LIPQPPKEGETYTRNTEARAKDGEVTSKEIEVDVIGEEGRKGFDVREFCERHGMSCKEGGAVHMWREVWSERTNKVYREILSECLISPSCSLAPLSLLWILPQRSYVWTL
jgi:large subunit ribosomal protein L35